MKKKILLLAMALVALASPIRAEVIFYINALTTMPEGWTDYADTEGKVSQYTFIYDNILWIIDSEKFENTIRYTYDWVVDGTTVNVGLRFGSEQYPLTKATLSTSDFMRQLIDTVTVKVRGTRGIDATVAVTVGGVPLLCNGEETHSLPYNPAESYTFVATTPVAGELVITFNQPETSEAMMLHELTIGSAGEIDGTPHLAYEPTHLAAYVDEIRADSVAYPLLTYDETFTASDEITYSTSNSDVITIGDNGTAALTGQPGVATITATFDGNDMFDADSATYSVDVRAGKIHTFTFDMYDYGMTTYSATDDNYESAITAATGKEGARLSLTGNYRRVYQEGFRVGELQMEPNSTLTINPCTGKNIFKITIHSTDGTTTIWQGEQTANVVFSYETTTYIDYIDVVYSTGEFVITDAGYATLYLEEAYILPTGVQGTTITGVVQQTTETGTVTAAWEYDEGATVPAETPLVLRGEPATYSFSYTTTTTTAPADNILQGAVTTTTTTAHDGTTDGYRFYKLAEGDNGVGFYFYDETGGTFPSNPYRAWLTLADTQAHSHYLPFGETTGINAPTTVSSSSAATTIYSLDGQARTTPQKGVNIVRNADGTTKKIIF